MKFKKMKLLTMTGLLISNIAFASGDRVGNGGDAVVCANGVYMLDYIEAYSNDNSYEENDSVQSLVSKHLSQLEIRDERVHTAVLKTSSAILESIDSSKNPLVSFTTRVLLNLDDEGFYALPKGCKLEQLIVRRETNSLQKTEFLIQRNLWDRMSNYQKSVGIIHEALYKYYISSQRENKNSEVARFINTLVIKKELGEVSDRDYISYLKEKGITLFQISNVQIAPYLRHNKYYANGSIKEVKQAFLNKEGSIFKSDLLISKVKFSINRELVSYEVNDKALYELASGTYGKGGFYIQNGNLVVAQGLSWTGYILKLDYNRIFDKSNIFVIDRDTDLSVKYTGQEEVQISGICHVNSPEGGFLSSSYWLRSSYDEACQVRLVVDINGDFELLQ